jgi:hypothetical protein
LTTAATFDDPTSCFAWAAVRSAAKPLVVTWYVATGVTPTEPATASCSLCRCSTYFDVAGSVRSTPSSGVAVAAKPDFPPS